MMQLQTELNRKIGLGSDFSYVYIHTDESRNILRDFKIQLLGRIEQHWFDRLNRRGRMALPSRIKDKGWILLQFVRGRCYLWDVHVASGFYFEVSYISLFIYRTQFAILTNQENYREKEKEKEDEEREGGKGGEREGGVGERRRSRVR